MKKYSNEEIIELFQTFTDDKFSLILSTSSTQNDPLTNYTPFVENDGKYYVVMSSMMLHYKNIVQTKKAHVLIMEDEQDASHIFARKRLYFPVSCKIVNNEDFYELFDKRYDDELSFIKEMKDFQIVELTAHEKSLVLGFGAAYKMDTQGQLINKNIAHK